MQGHKGWNGHPEYNGSMTDEAKSVTLQETLGVENYLGIHTEKDLNYNEHN